MNKQEAIEKINEIKKVLVTRLARSEKKSLVFNNGVSVVEPQDVIDIINQIDEPEKPVIPQFVADWIEYCKKNNLTLTGAFDPVSEHGIGLAETYKGNACECTRWALNNQNLFARAWLNGYSVIKEPLYWVNVPNGDRIDLKLCKTPENEIVLDSFGCSKLIDHKLKLTKHEIENAGFGWVFDCGFAKEVKE